MPRLIPFRLVAVCALAFVLSIALTATAVAKGVSANLRVVGKGGKVLTEQTLSTGTTTIKTSKKADCFGAGTGGSGGPAKIKGATALGLLGQAAKSTASLQPLLITDAFDFGLGICGVGNSVVSGKASWYLKVNHKGAQVGGELVKLHAGDDVLWDLAPSYPYPNELALVAPATATVGVPFGVRVFSYDEKGKRSPVYRASVSGATEPTDSDGRTMVTLSSPGLVELTAKHGKDIPAPAVPICLGSECAASPTG